MQVTWPICMQQVVFITTFVDRALITFLFVRIELISGFTKECLNQSLYSLMIKSVNKNLGISRKLTL